MSDSQQPPITISLDTAICSKKKIFVGGLNPFTSKSEIFEAFNKYGRIIEICLPQIPKSRRTKGFCIIKYGNLEAARAAHKDCNNIYLGGFKVEVRIYVEPKKASKFLRDVQARKIYISGFPLNSTEREIKVFLLKFGKVEDLKMQYQETIEERVFKGTIFAVMESKTISTKILKLKNLSFGGRNLEVQRALSKKKLRNLIKQK